MTWQVWSAFVLIETVLCLTPGPAVLLVLSQALTRGTAKTLWSIVGILTANTAYFVLSATGIGAILLASYDLFFAIKWLGAAYLVWLGVSAFIGSSKTLSVRRSVGAPTPGRRLFFNGFVLQMSNPKALLFFTALLPQFIDPRWTIVPQVAILAVTSVVIEFVVQLFYAVLAGRAAMLVSQPRYARIADRLSGSLLIGAGIGMAALRRA
jgi:threonine/homoserine/homoserine lactone efflux protein